MKKFVFLCDECRKEYTEEIAPVNHHTVDMVTCGYRIVIDIAKADIMVMADLCPECREKLINVAAVSKQRFFGCPDMLPAYAQNVRPKKGD